MLRPIARAPDVVTTSRNEDAGHVTVLFPARAEVQRSDLPPASASSCGVARMKKPRDRMASISSRRRPRVDPSLDMIGTRNAIRERVMMPDQTSEKAEVKMYSDFKSPYAYLALDPGMALGKRLDV